MISPEMIAVSIDLINQFGSTAQIQTGTDEDYVDGSIVETPILSAEFKAVIDSYKSEEIEGVIEVGDIRVTMTNEIVPVIKQRFIFKGKNYNIINVVPLWLEDVVVIYEIQCRK